MSIIRVRKHDRFVTVTNAIARNSELSWEARGLLLYLLSQADGWEVMEADLLAHGPAGRDKVRRMLEELKAAGHFRRVAVRQADGTFRYVTEIYEEPPLTENPEAARNEPLTEKPLTAEPLAAEPLTANPTLRKTEERNTYSPPLEAREADDPSTFAGTSRDRSGEDGGTGGRVGTGSPRGSGRASACGERLAPDWQPDVAYARSLGLLDAAVAREAEKFRNYWSAKPGADGRKLDWGATWRNWCIRASEDAAKLQRPAGGKPGGARLSPHEQLAAAGDVALEIRRRMREADAAGAMGAGGRRARPEGDGDAPGILLALPAPARRDGV